MYSPSYNPMCYKYNTHNSRIFRFDFPQTTLAELEINWNFIIWLKQDNVWVNPWNTAIVSLIPSNYNVNFILSSIKALVLIYYITNYTTKDNCSECQKVMTAVIVRKHSRIITKIQQITLALSLDKFALKAFY